MRTGPTSQFCTRDRSSTFRSENTSGNSSYFTRASGGYIISTRPIAIGKLVEPTDILSKAAGTPGTREPNAVPKAMARKIQRVRYRSRKESFRLEELVIIRPHRENYWVTGERSAMALIADIPPSPASSASDRLTSASTRRLIWAKTSAKCAIASSSAP